MSNEQGYEEEISPEEENAYYAAQAQWEDEAEARAQMEAAMQQEAEAAYYESQEADRAYYEAQMAQQAQEEHDRQTYRSVRLDA